MRWLMTLWLVLVLCGTTSCGGSAAATTPTLISTTTPTPTPTPTPPTATTSCLANHGSMSATINGVPWVAVCVVANPPSDAAGGPSLSFNGNDSTFSMEIDLEPATAPGIFPVGTVLPTGPVNGAALFGFDSGGVVTSSWHADSLGGSGLISLITISATGASGTFNFNMVPEPTPPTTGTRVVTNGVFNITF